MKTSTRYIVVPREKKVLKKHEDSLQTLRRAVSRAWKGASAVTEIRSQRKRNV